jgi:hypothetical protein
MGSYFKVCDICYAHIDEHHLDAHKRWHRTLSNTPLHNPDMIR